MNFLDQALIQNGDYTFTVFNLLTIILIILIARISVMAITRLIKRKIKGISNLDPDKGLGVIHLLKYLIYTIAILFGLQNAGVELTVLLAGSTALMVGVGLGLQNTFNDFVSGIILVFEGSLQTDDIIEVDGIIGRVKSTGLRTSKLQTREDISLIVPNSKIISNNLINWSHNNESVRFSVKVGVSYRADVEVVRKCLLSCLDGYSEVLTKPAPAVRFIDFGESSLDFELLFYSVNRFRIEEVKSEVRFRIWHKLKESGVEIPFPQRDLHIKSYPKDSEKVIKTNLPPIAQE